MYTYDNSGNKVQLSENYDDAQFSFKKPDTKKVLYILAVLLVLFLLYRLYNQKRGEGMAFSKQRYGFQFF